MKKKYIGISNQDFNVKILLTVIETHHVCSRILKKLQDSEEYIISHHHHHQCCKTFSLLFNDT